MLQGTSYGRAAFERFTDTTTPTGTTYVYSNVRAREDSENRAAQVVADDLKTRVAIYLSGARLRLPRVAAAIRPARPAG